MLAIIAFVFKAGLLWVILIFMFTFSLAEGIPIIGSAFSRIKERNKAAYISAAGKMLIISGLLLLTGSAYVIICLPYRIVPDFAQQYWEVCLLIVPILFIGGACALTRRVLAFCMIASALTVVAGFLLTASMFFGMFFGIPLLILGRRR